MRRYKVPPDRHLRIDARILIEKSGCINNRCLERMLVAEQFDQSVDPVIGTFQANDSGISAADRSWTRPTRSYALML